MITDSNDFARCADGWSLWNKAADMAEKMSPEITLDALVEYKNAFDAYIAHVEACPVCKAQEGRFMQSLEEVRE